MGIRKAKSDVAQAKTQVTNVESLKREVHHLNKTLLREETKAKALQEELENPMNVHRWRALEGSDPATYEMIQKVKTRKKRWRRTWRSRIRRRHILPSGAFSSVSRAGRW